MGGILDKLDEWLRGLLVEGITGNLSGMFDTVNTKVGEIAGEVGMTPQAWNGGVFSMIRNLSETVIVPIAGVILTFVMCYELIQLVTEKNNLHDIDTWMFFKWIFKTFCAVLIVTNTWNIVMGVFDVAQSVVGSSAGVIIGSTSIDINSVITDMEGQLEALPTGELFGLWFQSLFVGLTMNALSICIMLVIYGRMIEVYLTTSIGPIPLATMTNRDWGTTGQNYLRSLFALGFQAFLIIAELDNIFMRLYEDNISGKLTDERFRKLSQNYENEQSCLKDQVALLREEIEKVESQCANVDRFLSIVERYTEIPELTPHILHEFVDKIVVHSASDPHSRTKRRQEVDIYYKGIGILEMSKVFTTRENERNGIA